ncbi:putative chromosome segregation protein [Patellaria atrata CBS 101060]|uniref:Chromosome segregation protein n=1 Tax=Patellaria atrata CBS 101060 TaxID=1346257 RepID=A0A9P4SD39_9PEZI|nr:putative chromosome segregation protein [Patellaria atrata CBS 101060]
MSARIRGRPAHTPGPTFLSYTPNGRKLITVGLNNAIRVFQTGSDAEPANIDDCQDSNTAIAASNDFFVTGSDDGTVCKYSLETNSLDEILVRCSVAVRDVALSPDGNWVAVASDELVVKVVNTNDMTRVIYLRDQPRSVKHVSFDPSGTYLTASCTDGVVYVYSLSSEQPKLVRKVDDLIRSLEPEVEASSKVVWHPDGRAFGAPTGTREFQVMSHRDWEKQRAFSSGHSGDITAVAWSPNGALLATAGADRKLVLWDTKSQKVIKTYDDVRATILEMSWHPTENIFSYTNNDGELYIHPDFVPAEYISALKKDLQPAPFIHDPLSEISGNVRRQETDGSKNGLPRRTRDRTPDSLDGIIDGDGMSDVDGFIEDDDDGGYVEPTNGLGKRANDDLNDHEYPYKRARTQGIWQPKTHASFQPGSTPWRGNRRYLCLNLVGFVWTVSQEDAYHTVTVEFYDRELHRDFHFTDPFLYDKACLNEHGALFSCSPSSKSPAIIYYRPHETWTTRTDWRTELPAGETPTAIALSESHIVVTTNTGYVRIYSLFGVPLRVHRAKASPTVTCAAWRDYVWTIGNGPLGSDGRTTLRYTIENVRRDDVCQAEDILPLPATAELKSIFFSDAGDPCIYDSTGVLLVLLHWRLPGQARWAPLLDTKKLSRLASGKKEESYWPVAVAGEKFHCIILKGGDTHPYFPRPLLTDFDFRLPVSAAPPPPATDDDALVSDTTKDPAHEAARLEEQHARHVLLHALLSDALSTTRATHEQQTVLAAQEREADKALLQLLAIEAREGEEHGMKALEIVTLMRDRSGKMLEAAGRVAERFGREVLAGKIREVAEGRLGEEDEEF